MALHLLPQADDEGNIGHPDRIWERVRVYTIVFKDGTELTEEPSVVTGTSDILDKWEYTYSPVPNGGSPYDIVHNQGKVPFTIVWCLRCTQAELGYSVGDKLWPDQCNGDHSHGITIYFEGIDRYNEFRFITGAGSAEFVKLGHTQLAREKWDIDFTLFFLT